MKIDNIQRSEETRTRISNTMEVISADEGMKLINQDYLDKITDELIIAEKVFLAVESSSLDWAEITEAEALKYQEEYQKYLDSLTDNNSILEEQ